MVNVPEVNSAWVDGIKESEIGEVVSPLLLVSKKVDDIFSENNLKSLDYHSPEELQKFVQEKWLIGSRLLVTGEFPVKSNWERAGSISITSEGLLAWWKIPSSDDKSNEIGKILSDGAPNNLGVVGHIDIGTTAERLQEFIPKRWNDGLAPDKDTVEVIFTSDKVPVETIIDWASRPLRSTTRLFDI